MTPPAHSELIPFPRQPRIDRLSVSMYLCSPDISCRWTRTACGLGSRLNQQHPSHLTPEHPLSVYSPFPPAGRSDGLSQFLTHLANCLPCARHYSKLFTNTEPFNPHSNPVRWRLLLPHFTDGEAEAQRSEGIYPRAHSLQVTEQDL